MRNFNFRNYGDNLLFALALAVLITAVFHFAGRRDNTPAVINIVFTQWWQEDIQGDFLQNLIAEFESLHEGIKVILNEKPYEELRQALFIPAAYDDENDGETPLFPGDVLALDPLWVPELFNRNAIESAESSFLSFINVLYFNIDILREAGFTRPPRTRSEFLTFARAIAARGGGPVLGIDASGSRGIYDTVYPWIWAAGARLINNGIPLATTPPIVQSLSFLASLNDEGLIAPHALSSDSQNRLEDFISGRTAFMIAPTRYIGRVRERMGDQAFGITTIPALDNQTTLPFLATVGWTIGVNSASAHKEEASLFSAFLAGRAPLLLNNVRGAIPTAPGLDPFYSNIWEIALAGETAADFAGIAEEHKLEAVFREELSALFAGIATPAETAAAIQQRWLVVLRD